MFSSVARHRLVAAAGILIASVGLLPAAASAAPPTAPPAVPVTSFLAAALDAFRNPAQSPSGVNTGCRPSVAHPYPVVLVNGTFEVMIDSFGALGPALANAGYCVFGYNYGGNAASPVQATDPVLDGVTALGAEVHTVLSATGATKVDLVGYSQGGLITELYTKFGGASTVHSVTALAPTTHGTTLLGIGTLGAAIPGALPLLSAAGCPACSDQVVGSPVIGKLDTGPVAVSGIPYTVIDTVYEDIVTPTGSSFIDEPHVVNQYVQQFSWLDTVEHVGLPFDPVAISLTLKSLTRAAASTT